MLRLSESEKAWIRSHEYAAVLTCILTTNGLSDPSRAVLSPLVPSSALCARANAGMPSR